MIGLEFIIKTRKLKNKDIADLLNVPAPQINDWKKGRRPIPKHHLEKLSVHFGLEPDFFQRKVSDEDVIKYYKSVIEKEISKKVEIKIKEGGK
ncbi:helix-turn-helix transcriptional regulator [Geobacillus thermodenitrificans]|uniref:helix-turn-helix domain-containing protein n=1 Tax=Geobacillus thermodenitrificans TaxID=33940 RepID=UPI003D22807D